MESEKIEPILSGEKSWRDVAKSIVFIAVAIGVAYFVTVSIGLDNLRLRVESAGIYAPLIVILLKATTIVVVPLGGTPIYPIAGALWGFWQGLGITLIGDALGATIAFYLSRFFGQKILHFFMSRQQMPIIEKLVLKGSEPKTFIKARIFFAGFPELFAYASGLTKISYPIFIFAHMSVHAVSASLLVLFGELLVSGNIKVMILAGLISSALAFAGVWWFHVDLTKGN